MATLMDVGIGQTPQSAGHVRQLSSSSQVPSPHTDTNAQMKVHINTPRQILPSNDFLDHIRICQQLTLLNQTLCFI